MTTQQHQTPAKTPRSPARQATSTARLTLHSKSANELLNDIAQGRMAPDEYATRKHQQAGDPQ